MHKHKIDNSRSDSIPAGRGKVSALAASPQKSETLTFTNGTLTVQGVSAQGRSFLWSFTPVPGKPVLVTGRDNLTVETKESGNSLVHMWSDQSGTSYGEGQISEDGKSIKYVLVGTRWGNHVYEVSVFDKVVENAATSKSAPTR